MPSYIKLTFTQAVKYRKKAHMRAFLIIHFVFCAATLNAREHSRPYVALSASEYLHPVYDSTVKDVYTNEQSKVVVRHYDKRVEKYPCDQVWGYKGRDGVGYRSFNSRYYKIEQVDTLVIYERRVRAGKIRKRVSYFSRGHEGDVYELREKELRDVFSDNPAFLSLLRKDLKWYQMLNSYSEKKGTYRVVAFYRRSIF